MGRAKEEHFIDQLVEYDEALDEGVPAAATLRGSSNLTRAWRQAQKCLDLLASVWRKGPGDRDQAATMPACGEATPSCTSPAAPVLECGRDFGRFHILEILGEGGMGTVYKAFHTRLHRPVALKVLAPRWAADPEALARFHAEMKMAGGLDHQHLVRALDAGESDGIHFLVMEYIDGADLGAMAGAIGPFPIADACEAVRQAATGLESVHRSGLVHRDIKPSNLMLGRDGRVRLLDLGLALLRSPGRKELTKPGQTLGTADYMAPEQLLDPRSVDARTDIYSLGCTLYYLLCGQPPFGGERFDTAGKKMLAHAMEPVPSLRAQRRDVPPELEAVVEGMLAKEPGQRFSACTAVSEALAPFAAGCDLAGLFGRLEAGVPPSGGCCA